MMTLTAVLILCVVVLVVLPVVLLIAGLPFLILLSLLPWLLRVAGVILLLRALFQQPVESRNFIPPVAAFALSIVLGWIF